MQICNAKPDPPSLFLRNRHTYFGVVNRLSIVSVYKHVLVSDIWIVTRSSLAVNVVRIRMHPPGCENLMPLSTKLRTTVAMASLSAYTWVVAEGSTNS